MPGHEPAAAQSSDAPCENSRETEPNTQDTNDDLDWAYDWYKDDHAAGYETPEPYDVPDLSDSDDDEEMQTKDQMVEAFVNAGADPNFAKMRVKTRLQMDSQKPTTFMEVDGGGAICHEANRSRRSLNVRGIAALDHTTC